MVGSAGRPQGTCLPRQEDIAIHYETAFASQDARSPDSCPLVLVACPTVATLSSEGLCREVGLTARGVCSRARDGFPRTPPVFPQWTGGLSIGNDKIEVPSGPVLKHGPRSLSCARANGRPPEHQRRKKHNLSCAGLRARLSAASLHPRVLYQACGGGSRAATVPQHTVSVQDVTRKMVNYA